MKVKIKTYKEGKQLVYPVYTGIDVDLKKRTLEKEVEVEMSDHELKKINASRHKSRLIKKRLTQ